jgi:hypothetical protein
MKKYMLSILLVLLLSACKSSTYTDVGDDDLVDGYTIYQKEASGLFCNSYWEDIYYSDETYNYGYRYQSCSADQSFFIKDKNGDYVYLRDALDEGLITLESLIPRLMRLERHPEEISNNDADYYWLDFHIGRHVVYAYAGGVCDEDKTETFTINGELYGYRASGCLKDNILFMRIDGENIPVATLLSNGTIEGNYLIPLLTKQTE